jgi:RNA polymerase sigma-54 factor
MRNSVGQSARVERRASLSVDPKLVVAARILELPQFELEQAIEQELNDNPALERNESEPESLDEARLVRELAHERERPVSEDAETISYRAHESVDDADWIDFLAAAPSLRDHLLAQLTPTLSEEHKSLGAYVVECVNSKGYLSMPIEEIANAARAALEDVSAVVAAIQRCDPPGVGAASLRECIMLQLRDDPNEIAKLARAIVREYWEDLIARRTAGICRRFRIMPQVAEEAFRHIAGLTPYPGEAFVSELCPQRQEESTAVAPDVVFRREESGITFEVRGSDPAEFAINEWYRTRHDSTKPDAARESPEERKHVGEFVTRASRFIGALRQRRATLRRIAAFLITKQHGFITTGSYSFLNPLTRTAVAKSIGLHESTISRAMMGKFVQLPNGETIPFDVFFKPQLRVQKMIEEILAQENPNAPMSDRVIADMLAERGVNIARRTVNKYREQIHLLSSHRRRIA